MYETPKSNVVDDSGLGNQKHSGVGIASFILSICMFLIIIGAFGYVAYQEVNTPGGIKEESAEAIVVGLAVIGCCALLMIGLILGVVGIFQKYRRKLFPILGTCLNGITICIVGFVIWLGIVGR